MPLHAQRCTCDTANSPAPYLPSIANTRSSVAGVAAGRDQLSRTLAAVHWTLCGIHAPMPCTQIFACTIRGSLGKCETPVACQGVVSSTDTAWKAVGTTKIHGAYAARGILHRCGYRCTNTHQIGSSTWLCTYMQ